MSTPQSDDFMEAIRQLLYQADICSQAEMVDALIEQGFEGVNQSKVSRTLNKLGAVRARNSKDEMVYCLPAELTVPTVRSPLTHLVLSIAHNQALIVVRTLPAAAPLLARMLDSLGDKEGILGTVAGDDTIFISPQNLEDIDTLCANIQELLQREGSF